MIFKESEVHRIRSMLRQRAQATGNPTTITEAIRFTLENAEPLAIVPMSHVTAGEENRTGANCSA